MCAYQDRSAFPVAYVVPAHPSSSPARGLGLLPCSAPAGRKDELYNDDTLARLQDSGFIGHWGGRYLTSNVVGAADGEPIGARFVVLTAPVTGARVLVLGFLYNFAGACPSSRVETVEASLAAGWIKPALAAEDYAVHHCEPPDPSLPQPPHLCVCTLTMLGVGGWGFGGGVCVCGAPISHAVLGFIPPSTRRMTGSI